MTIKLKDQGSMRLTNRTCTLIILLISHELIAALTCTIHIYPLLSKLRYWSSEKVTIMYSMAIWPGMRKVIFPWHFIPAQPVLCM